MSIQIQVQSENSFGIVTSPLLCYQENIGGNIHLFAWYNFLQMFDVVDGEFTT